MKGEKAEELAKSDDYDDTYILKRQFDPNDELLLFKVTNEEHVPSHTPAANAPLSETTKAIESLKNNLSQWFESFWLL